MTQTNAITPFNAYAAVEMVKQLRLAVDILRGSGELVPGVDFGKIPGAGDKDILLLPGMEKLCRALNAVPTYVELHVDRDYEKPLFHYEYECTLRDADTGVLIPGGRGLGLCNSMETGFRFRWVQAFEIPEELKEEKLQKRGGKTSEFEFAINKGETSGKYGKPAEYWQAFKDAITAGSAVKGERETSRGKSPTWEIDTTVYRIPNPDIYDQVNAIMKRAKKRSLGDAIKGAANVSAYFTVDMEDFVPGVAVNPDTDFVEGTVTVVKPVPPASGHKSASEPSAAVRGAGINPTPPTGSPASTVPTSANGDSGNDLLTSWADDADEWQKFLDSADKRFGMAAEEVETALTKLPADLGDWHTSKGWATAAVVAAGQLYAAQAIEAYTGSQKPEGQWFDICSMALAIAKAQSEAVTE